MPEGCALVTGGSRGIGAAIARALAAEGWPVAVNFRVDGRVALNGILIALIAGIIGGMLPALRAARTPITTALREI